jgi:hypothetical protein
LGCANGNGSRRRWGKVVEWCVPGGSGGRVPHLLAQSGVAGFGPKVRMRATREQFRERRWEWRWGAMGRCGGVWCMGGYSGLGGRLTARGRVVGLGLKVRNRAIMAQFGARSRMQVGMWGSGVSQGPCTWKAKGWGVGSEQLQWEGRIFAHLGASNPSYNCISSLPISFLLPLLLHYPGDPQVG